MTSAVGKCLRSLRVARMPRPQMGQRVVGAEGSGDDADGAGVCLAANQPGRKEAEDVAGDCDAIKHRAPCGNAPLALWNGVGGETGCQGSQLFMAVALF